MNLIPVMALALAPAAAEWRTPPPGVTVSEEGQSAFRVRLDADREYALDSLAELPAKPGAAFLIEVRVRLDLDTRALPDLACLGADGREIPSPSPLATGTDTSTTNWQTVRRVIPVKPGTARVRARVWASGRGELLLAGLVFRAEPIDPYRTGALITPLHPKQRRGLVLESNHSIVNEERVSAADRDGDGKWALILTDLDKLSEPLEEGVDWRTKFEYRPNEIYWSDGAVLKSDSVLADRAPDFARALHFRARLHAGPYRAILGDPGRAAAVSLDGKTWRRIEGGREAELGVLPVRDGALEFWLDACYRDPVSAGPVYFDYVRLFPADDEPAAEKLFVAARQRVQPPARGSVDGKRVAVSVADAPAGWPVRCGLPVPRGELASAGGVAVRAPDGTVLPADVRVSARWPDGSVKWALADFLSVGSGRYAVEYGNAVRPPAPARAVAVERTDAGLQVDTGAVRFLVPGARFGILEDVRLPSGKVVQARPISAEIVGEDGSRAVALDLPVSRLVVERAGPVHARILVETKLAESGKPAEGFFHRARIHVWAGSPLVEVDYFLANTTHRGAEDAGWPGSKIRVRSITLGMETAGEVGVGVEAMAEQMPKAIRRAPGRVEIALWDPAGGLYNWIEGVGKTHRIRLLYGARGEEKPLDGDSPLALAAPEWYAASGAFGPISTAARGPLPEVEKTLADHIAGPVVAGVGKGYEDWGDHSSSGYVKDSRLWDNNEYDLPAGALAHFARTGDRGALRVGLAAARHYVDVDTVHYSAGSAALVGAPHSHSHGTFGHHTAEKPNMSHAGYVQGLLLYTYLTGDEWGLEGARGIADWALRSLRPESNTGSMERILGHPLMTLNDVYEATWEDKYLRGAAKLVDWAMKWEHPVRGGLLAPVTEQPAYYSSSGFNGGMTYAALVKFAGWAGRPEIDAMLERLARQTLTEMWRPPANILSKGGSPRRAAKPEHIASHSRLMTYVYGRTRDPLFLVVPRVSVAAGFSSGGADIGTRSTGLVLNYLPWFLAALEENGNPVPEPGFAVRPRSETVEVRRGAAARVCFTVPGPVEWTAVSFQPRLDFTASREESGADQLCWQVTAPPKINLTSGYNRDAYAHFSGLYRRGGRLHGAHAWVRLRIAE